MWDEPKGVDMPNLVVEYSSSVDERVNTQGLLEDLHQVLIDSGLFYSSSSFVSASCLSSIELCRLSIRGCTSLSMFISF